MARYEREPIMSGKNKKRSVIYTNDWDIDAGMIIQRMCSRWGQENMIKALKLRHLIDYHPGYLSEELEDQPLVDNPELIELKPKFDSKIFRRSTDELFFMRPERLPHR